MMFDDFDDSSIQKGAWLGAESQGCATCPVATHEDPHHHVTTSSHLHGYTPSRSEIHDFHAGRTTPAPDFSGMGAPPRAPEQLGLMSRHLSAADTALQRQRFTTGSSPDNLPATSSAHAFAHAINDAIFYIAGPPCQAWPAAGKREG